MCPSAVSVDVRANLTRVRNTYIQWWQNEYTELHNLSVSQCAQTHCQIVFNTSSLLFSGTIVQEKLLQRDVTEVLCCYLFLGAIGNFSGVVRTTSSGTEVAVFSFNSIYLGPEVEVVVVGQRALSLVSKTTAIINTTIHARPGTLGGFRGGESVAKLQSEYLYDDPQSLYICNLGDYCLNPAKYNNQTILGSELVSNNINGPGSGNLRVIPFVVTTSATVISEVQVITTSAQSGQTLSGGFILHFGAYSTTIIPFDASEAEMKEAIESNLNLASPENYPVLPVRVLEQEGAAGKGTKQHHGIYAVRNGGVCVCAGVGVVSVSRTAIGDTQHGYTWSVTFTTAIGNIDQMTVTSFLTGLKANVTVHTATQGNELGGYFTLTYLNHTSQPISVRESAQNVQRILMNMPPVSTAYVVRNDPTNNCDDGLCPNGPFLSRYEHCIHVSVSSKRVR
jgi:hypothetical protein